MDTRRRFLDRVRDHLRKLQYSYRTEQQHLFWIRRFILFYGKRHPSDMAARETASCGQSSPATCRSYTRRTKSARRSRT
jgi:hypothetical protein